MIWNGNCQGYNNVKMESAKTLPGLIPSGNTKQSTSMSQLLRRFKCILKPSE